MLMKGCALMMFLIVSILMLFTGLFDQSSYLVVASGLFAIAAAISDYAYKVYKYSNKSNN